MKLNLLIDNPKGCRSGYFNVDPFTPDNDDSNRIKGNVINVDHIADDAECEEIIAYDILDYMRGQDGDETLTHWLSKLKHGGKLTVSFTDLQEVSQQFAKGTLPLDQANTILHGEQQEDWQFKKSTFTLGVFCEVIKNKFPNFKILCKRISGYQAFVTLERN